MALLAFVCAAGHGFAYTVLVNPRNLLIVFASAITLLSVTAAHAQTNGTGGSQQVSRSAEPDRSAVTFGVSIGRGSIAIDCPVCDDVDAITEALSFSAHVGYMVTPRLAVIGEYWTVRYSDRGSDWFPDSRDHAVIQNVGTIGGQLWLTSRLYVRAGIGVGRHSSDSLYTKPHVYETNDNFLRAGQGGNDGTDTSGSLITSATTFGIGFEFAHTTKFAADVQFRIGRTDTNRDKYSVTNTGLTFGISWY